MNQKLIPVIAIVVMLLSGGALAFQARASLSTAKPGWLQSLDVSMEEALQSFSDAFIASFEDREAATPIPFPSPASQKTASPSPVATARPGTTPRPVATARPTATPKATTVPETTIIPPAALSPPKQQADSCQRYLVKHLDGSTSNRCYAADDYRQLATLESQLSSAQHFYDFHIEGVNRYQKLYEDSGSSLWLDAKASSQASADREKEKIGSLSLQMYTIESRGKD